MLKQLLIRNVALVDELAVDFGRGLNVLTGETGAGKSIIVDSVNFLIGARADKDMIRSGAEKAYVEGLFDVSGNRAALDLLKENEMDAEDGHITLSRELTASGRSTCRIGGMAVNLGHLKAIAFALIDIHGQHEHQSLLNERNYLGFLDAFGDAGHQTLCSMVAERYRQYDEAKKTHKALLDQNARREERLQYLLLKRKEISAAKPRAGEEEGLRKALDSLRNAGKISRSLQDAYAVLYDTRSDGDAALRLLQTAMSAMAEIAGFDDRFETLRARIESMYYETEDVGIELRDAMHAFEADGGALQQAAERMDMLKRLSRKYGTQIDDLAEALEETESELKSLENIEDEIIRLEGLADKALDAYRKQADLLTRSRRGLAEYLAKRMKQELSELNMPGTEFIVELRSQKKGASSDGDDSITMLLAPNLGEEAKPLAKIASGGEVSRLMLALKSISAEHNVIPSMVFDEIDTGISGRTAQVVAQKMWNIARYRQVLCVTHLQQIAAMASAQYLVEKMEQGKRTISRVKHLNRQERVAELSRMISGYSRESESSLRHAEHMLKEAENYRLMTR
jgi:DNA repair protein RecN (Recombination protein N)